MRALIYNSNIRFLNLSACFLFSHLFSFNLEYFRKYESFLTCQIKTKFKCIQLILKVYLLVIAIYTNEVNADVNLEIFISSTIILKCSNLLSCSIKENFLTAIKVILSFLQRDRCITVPVT